MKIKIAFILLTLAFAFTGAARAQEGEARLIDEVIARINATPVMRSAFDAALKDRLEQLKASGLQGEELEKKFNESKPRTLDELIDTQLLAQRAKDLSINVEPQVNEQLLRIMKENNIQSLEDLEQKMREVGVDINEVRRNLSDRFATQAVMQREVYGKIYFSLTEKEKREYYDKNKEIFATPGEVTLSHIFIAIGKDADAALKRAQDVLTQARSAADFGALAQRVSEDPNTAAKKGLIGTLKIPELAPEVREAVEKLKAGEITNPVKLSNAYVVFRVDARKEPEVRSFDDKEIQDAAAQRLTYERSEKQIEDYLDKLRNDAFIEIDPRYQFKDSRVKSAQIKHTPYSEDSGKKKKKEKEKDKKAQEPEKAEKATANAKP